MERNPDDKADNVINFKSRAAMARQKPERSPKETPEDFEKRAARVAELERELGIF